LMKYFTEGAAPHSLAVIGRRPEGDRM